MVDSNFSITSGALDTKVAPLADKSTLAPFGNSFDSPSKPSSGAGWGTTAAYGSMAIASASNAFSQYVAFRSQANYQRSIGRINEMLSEYSYEQAIAQGERSVSEHRKAVRGLIGTQRAAYASQGVDVNFGSALDTTQGTNFLGEMDALTLKNNAYKQAFGFKLSALDASTQGKLLSTAASTQGAATLLSGGLQTFNYGLSAGYRSK